MSPLTGALRVQFNAIPEQFGPERLGELIARFTLFPAQWVSAGYVNDGRPRAADPRALAAAMRPPRGRLVNFVLSPDRDWTRGPHLLCANVQTRGDAHWVFSATLAKESVADAGNGRAGLDALASWFLDDLGATGGFAHPLADFVWQNQGRPAVRRLAGALPEAAPTILARGGHTVVDVEAMPTRIHTFGGVPLVAAATVWMGRAWHVLFPPDRLASFARGDENRALGDRTRRVLLYRDWQDTDLPEHRERQWAFRRHIGLDALAHALLRLPEPSDTTAEVQVKELPPGIAYRFRYFLDAQGEPAPRGKHARVIMYDRRPDGEFLAPQE